MVTIRSVYLDVLTELVKEESPVLYLEDFLYYYNKAISDYMKLRYEKFEMTQQLTDDMRVWKGYYKSNKLEIDINDIGDEVTDKQKEACAKEAIEDFVPGYAGGTPKEECTAACTKGCTGEDDEATCKEKCIKECMGMIAQETRGCIEKLKKPYRHLLGCIVDVKLLRPVIHCEQKPDTIVSYKATRSTSDRNTGLVDNVFFDAKFYRPYFDIVGDKLEIYVGDIDKNKIEISNITVEYLRQPAKVILTEEQIVSEVDYSQVLEFPIDVSEEITKIVIANILERDRDQRIGTHPQINKTVNDLSLGMGKK